MVKSGWIIVRIIYLVQINIELVFLWDWVWTVLPVDVHITKEAVIVVGVLVIDSSEQRRQVAFPQGQTNLITSTCKDTNGIFQYLAIKFPMKLGFTL